MGIDFRIDDDPRYRLDGTHTDWRGAQTYEDELISADELRALFEDAPERIDLHITAVPQQPPLPPEVVALDRSSPAWAYSGFFRFRRRLAATIGVELDLMEAYFNEHWAYKRYFGDQIGGLPSGEYERRLVEVKRRWEQEARLWRDIDSGLVPLLHHSDCDGDLLPEDCAKAAAALREAISKFELEQPEDYDATKGIELAGLMDACAEYGRRLVFC